MENFQQRFIRAFDASDVRNDFCFCNNTTVGVGGRAALAVYPRRIPELISVIQWLQRESVPYCMLGNGSNVLVSNHGFDGIVIVTKKLSGICDQDGAVYAECGTQIGSLLNYAANHGLGGAAYLAGIPATVGGAVYMNAGAQGRWIGELVHSVRVLENGKVYDLSGGDCRFAYKSTRFMMVDKIAILSVRFILKRQNLQSILSEINSVKMKRKNLPIGKSMGCVFKNPAVGISAGELIERAGLKGACAGDAIVSVRHANFILNRGNASAADFTALIVRIKEEVWSRFGIRLEEEIRYIGDF